MPAWWVHAGQVSKTGPGGLLSTGEFAIQGEKNFLAPSQIALGLGVMFQISKESVRNHRGRENVPEEQEEPPGEAVEDGGEGKEDEEQGKEDEQVNEQEEGQQREGEREKQEKGEEEDKNEEEQGSDSGVQQNHEGDSLDKLLKPRTSADDNDEKIASGRTDTVQERDQVARGKQTTGPEDVEEQASQVEEQDSQEKETPPAAPHPENKQHLSTRERRLMKNENPTESSSAATSSVAGGTVSKTTSKSTHTPAPTRGKKAKGKKVAAKYADQDEEERELALRLLGANNNAKTQKAAAGAANKANRAREAERQKQRRRAQHDRAAEAERKRQAIFEQGTDDQDEETLASEAADLACLPALVGKPLPEDEILAAIPVCAPSAALSKCRYRVKLLPGTVKKGKAVREIIGRWIAETAATGKAKKDYAEDAGISLSAAEKLSAREGEMFKGWKDAEIINCVPVGGVRIAFPGGGGGGRGDGKAKTKGGGGKGGKGSKKR